MAERKILKAGVKKIMAVSFIVNSALILAFLVLSFAQEINVKEKIKQENPGSADARVAGLIEGLGDRNPEVRESSEKQLVKTGTEAVPGLLAALDSARKRDAVARIFNNMGCDAIDPLLKLLDKEETRTKAGSMLFQSASPGCAKYIGRYLVCMENAEYGNYCGAALVKTSGPKAKSWLPELKKRMTIDPSTPDIRLSSVEALRAGNAYSRAYVIAAIGEMGKKASSSVPDLIAALNDPSPLVRLSAVVALRKTGVKNQAVRDALNTLVTGDTDSEVRREAEESLKALK